MESSLRCEVVGLDLVYELAFRLFECVRDSGYEPSVVVAIARGGYVPARLVCDFLRCRNLTSFGIRHYEPGARRGTEAHISDPLSFDVGGQRALVIDDVNDTGKTIVAARQHLIELGAAEVRVGVLHEKQRSAVRADYRAFDITDGRWLIYQWAVVEDVIGFIEQLSPAPECTEQARARLASEIGVTLEDGLWAKVLGAMPKKLG